jgi:hypothetical protein
VDAPGACRAEACVAFVWCAADSPKAKLSQHGKTMADLFRKLASAGRATVTAKDMYQNMLKNGIDVAVDKFERFLRDRGYSLDSNFNYKSFAVLMQAPVSVALAQSKTATTESLPSAPPTASKESEREHRSKSAPPRSRAIGGFMPSMDKTPPAGTRSEDVSTKANPNRFVGLNRRLHMAPTRIRVRSRSG